MIFFSIYIFSSPNTVTLRSIIMSSCGRFLRIIIVVRNSLGQCFVSDHRRLYDYMFVLAINAQTHLFILQVYTSSGIFSRGGITLFAL